MSVKQGYGMGKIFTKKVKKTRKAILMAIKEKMRGASEADLKKTLEMLVIQK